MFKFASDRTFSRNRPDFDARAVWQSGAPVRDLPRFVQGGDAEKKIAANRLLGLREWAIGDPAVFPRNDFAFALERIARDGFTFVRQPPEPGHPLVSDFLLFL